MAAIFDAWMALLHIPVCLTSPSQCQSRALAAAKELIGGDASTDGPMYGAVLGQQKQPEDDRPKGATLPSSMDTTRSVLRASLEGSSNGSVASPQQQDGRRSTNASRDSPEDGEKEGSTSWVDSLFGEFSRTDKIFTP